MSNLGFQTVYRLFNAEDDIGRGAFFCRRNRSWPSCPSQRPAVDAPSRRRRRRLRYRGVLRVLRVGLVNVLTLLRLAGIPSYAAERSAKHPLIVIGGAVTFVT